MTATQKAKLRFTFWVTSVANVLRTTLGRFQVNEMVKTDGVCIFSAYGVGG